jgi:hypothetical protein
MMNFNGRCLNEVGDNGLGGPKPLLCGGRDDPAVESGSLLRVVDRFDRCV